MALFQKYNNENILVRAIIAGLLDVLNNNIQYNQVWGNREADIELIKVPWFYNQSGDERFMQDFYTHYADCLPPRPVDGNFDMVPRGVITYTGSGINAQRITSRYVQGRYIKEVSGKLESFVSYLYSIPINIRFDCEMWIDRQISALKIEQEIREAFYKTITYYIYYKGLRVGCTVGFPEEVGIDKNIKYSFESENKIKLTFQLEVESYQPVFDKTTEMKASTNIKRFGYRLYEIGQKKDGIIEVISPSEGATIPKGIPIWIEWNYRDEGAVIRNVDIYWTYTGETDLEIIDLMQLNYQYYIWNIPNDFTNYIEPTIIWQETDNMVVSRDPILKIIPDLSTGEITESSFRAFSEGYFLCPLDDASINLQLEMKNGSTGITTYSEDGKVWANIKYNKLDLTNPVTISPDTSIFYPGIVDYKNIDIHIANSVNPDTYGIIENLKIV